jgi:AraC-like DNA-binding protein
MLGDASLVVFENSPMAVERTAQQAARGRDEWFVCQQVAGRLVVEQQGSQAALEPGDMTLIDPSLPYEGRFFPASRSLLFKIPRNALEARLGKIREMVAVPVKPSWTESRLASAYLAMLPSYAGTLGSGAEQITKDHAIDLIALSLAKTTEDQQPRLSSGRRVVMTKLNATIETLLSDPALDAGTVAARAGVSVRYANSVLAEAGTSIMRLVQTRRLERCRRALEDRSQVHRSVSEIAYGWGFADMTHFGRKFKKAYGMVPSEYRRLLS